jgi:hypothetical protein
MEPPRRLSVSDLWDINLHAEVQVREKTVLHSLNLKPLSLGSALWSSKRSMRHQQLISLNKHTRFGLDSQNSVVMPVLPQDKPQVSA